MNILNRILLQVRNCTARHSTSTSYEIPEYFINAFHLANASVHDNVNWYYHNAIEVVFDKLMRVVQIRKDYEAAQARDFVLETIRLLEQCDKTLELKIPFKKDNGKVEIIQGFSVLHGLDKLHVGGVRMVPDLETTQVKALATLSTFKHACVQLPYGGAHSGLCLDPSDFTQDELTDLLQIFCSEITKRGFYGPKVSIFEPGVNISEDHMAMFSDQYSKITGTCSPLGLACATGKPFLCDGLYDYLSSVAEGILIGVDNIISNDGYMRMLEHEAGWKNKTFIIKGFGRMGMRFSELLHRLDVRCIGLSDSDVGFYKPSGLDILDLIKHKQLRGNLSNYTSKSHSKNVLEQPADFLIIADSHKTLNCTMAPQIQAKIVIEIASGAITPSAHKAFLARGVLVIPDVFTNASGSLASHIEHSRNMYNVENLGAKYAPSYLLNKLTRSTNVIYPYFAKAISSLKHENQDAVNKNVVTPVFCTKYQESSQKIMNIIEEHKLGLDIRTAVYVLAIEKIFNDHWERI